MKTRSSQLKQQQLQTKLQNVNDILQLKKIYNSIDDQNNTLRQDILTLKYKVDILMQKLKNKPIYTSKEDEGKIFELNVVRKELKDQYKIMTEIKKRKDSQLQGQTTEELTQQLSNLANNLKIVEQELVQTKVSVADIKSETVRLEQTIEVHESELARNQPKIAQFSQQNNELRKKIFSLRKISNQKQFQSVKIMNSMYINKTKASKNQQCLIQIEKQKLSTLKQKKVIGKEDIIDLATLEREVDALKKVVKKTEKQQLRSQNENYRLKQEKLRKNKEDVKYLKEQQDKRNRLTNELNKYKKAWLKHLQIQNNNQNLKEYVQSEIQIDQFVDQQPLRRDFAGVQGGKVNFDDRIALKENKKSFMVGFYIYELEHAASAKNLLVAIRAIYDDPEANVTNALPIPGHYLSKCKVSKYMLVEGDFIKLFKVKYSSSDSKILKIEIRTNKNNRYQFGDKRHFSDLVAGENVYGFDISIQEYPVCLFGSFNNTRSQWYMQSLGVEINEL